MDVSFITHALQVLASAMSPVHSALCAIMAVVVQNLSLNQRLYRLKCLDTVSFTVWFYICFSYGTYLISAIANNFIGYLGIFLHSFK